VVEELDLHGLGADAAERRLEMFLDRVVVTAPGQCIQCGACVVQCPESALRFRYADGSVVEADTIRSTRMNMVGKQTIRMPD
jgi:ferredoxin